MKWLETNREPWEMVQSHWNSTITTRLNDTRNNRDQSLLQILEKWPILSHPMGWSLIVEDFRHFERNATENDINIWTRFFSNIEKINPLAKKKIPRTRQLLQIIESDNSAGKCIYCLFVYYYTIIFMYL